MTPEEQASIQYRFSGYQLPMIQLDATGPAFYKLDEVHPYYLNQPAYWQKNAYIGNTLGTTGIVGGDIKIEPSGNNEPTTPGDTMGPIDF